MKKDQLIEERINLAHEVVSYLNEQAGRRFDYESQGTLKLFKASWSHKYGLKQYKGVIDYLVLKWKNDEKMNSYLRPKTLFSKENFPEYLEEARVMYMEEINKKRVKSFSSYSPAGFYVDEKLTDFKKYDPTT